MVKDINWICGKMKKVILPSFPYLLIRIWGSVHMQNRVTTHDQTVLPKKASREYRLIMLKCRVLKTELLLKTGLYYHKNIITVGDTVALVIDSRQAHDLDLFLSLIFCYKRQL